MAKFAVSGIPIIRKFAIRTNFVGNKRVRINGVWLYINLDDIQIHLSNMAATIIIKKQPKSILPL